MSTRATIEKELNDARTLVSTIEKDVKQLRDWISASERSLSSLQESLRRITEESIARARADLAHRENELQRQRDTIAANERLLAKLVAIGRTEEEILILEKKQDDIIVLLERYRAELRQLKMEFEEMTNPVVAAQCELVLPNNQRVALDPNKPDYTIGCRDSDLQGAPDIDLVPFGGNGQGVSRRHATISYTDGRWFITDLGSTNGTFLNEKTIVPNAPTALYDKTKIRLGNVMLFFRHVNKTTRLTMPSAL
jgi:hypothetical protein